MGSEMCIRDRVTTEQFANATRRRDTPLLVRRCAWRSEESGAASQVNNGDDEVPTEKKFRVMSSNRHRSNAIRCGNLLSYDVSRSRAFFDARRVRGSFDAFSYA